ncbi:hypothetical protein AVEN_206947-1 [Araneus ventricosus]|uniref:Uncharacterized protein n=1 Tax=Araneus ventricosus TaxID=182803 RepID=A0A4Y2PYK4_ARAVE|nr:hypothetical protein AVEN_4456-1 [Araneus ventricosus]GBN56085.1 hypothetical protein AVEN_197280-1 [Araneus ventricosus]GBN56132.1 hypothetical protein AVEN_114287-1 [Araneus ventricosus]GBN56162.1 hypothetical protein AVEN_206947-1 [Araneus ventricosus]
MSICTQYLSLDYFPTNSRIIFKESWLKMPALDWWKSSSVQLRHSWKRNRDYLCICECYNSRMHQLLSVLHENSARQVVSLTAVAIATGYVREYPCLLIKNENVSKCVFAL